MPGTQAAAGLRSSCRSARAAAPRATRCAARSTASPPSGDPLVSTLLSLSATAVSALGWAQKVAAPLPADFPPGPGESAPLLFSNPLAFLDSIAARYPGGVVGLRLAGVPLVLVFSPAAAEAVLTGPSERFTKRGTAFFPSSELVGEGLLVSDGELWKRQRRLSQPAFRSAAVATYAREMGLAAVALTQPGGAWGALTAGQIVVRDVYQDMNDLTLRIVSRALFGADVEAEAGAEINAAIAVAFSSFATRAALPAWLPSPDGPQFSAAVQRLDAAVYRIIAARRRQQADASTATESDDLLSRLLNGVDGEQMDDRALRDELMTLLVAGQETSSIVLAWCATMLAEHPYAAQRCAEEAAAVLGDRSPVAADFPNLHCVQAVVLETMRLLPPAYLVGRCAAVDVPLPGSPSYCVPEGATVLVSPYLLHRSSAAWRRPEAFEPFERFLDAEGRSLGGEALKGMGLHGSYIPFGAGSRNCIGTGFAMMEVVLVLAALCRCTEWRLAPGERRPTPAALITLRPGQARLLLVPRRRRGAATL